MSSDPRWVLLSFFVVFLNGLFEVTCDLACPTKFGYFPDPADCAGYYICTFGSYKTRKCGNGLQYKTTTQTCDVAKPDNCEQDGTSANRPKYTGPTMQPAGQAAVAAPAAATNPPDDTAAVAATPAPFPFETVQSTQKASYFSSPDSYATQQQQSDQYAPAPQAPATTTRSSLLKKYVNGRPTFAPRNNPTTKKNYDFWKDTPTTTTAPPSLRKPAQSNKPFRDSDYVSSVMKVRGTTPSSRLKAQQKQTATTSDSQDYQPPIPDVFRPGPPKGGQGQSGPQQGSFGTRQELQQQRGAADTPNFQFPQQSNGLGAVNDDTAVNGDQSLSWNQKGEDTWPDQGYQNAAASQAVPVDGQQQVGGKDSGDSNDKSGSGSVKPDRRQFPRPSSVLFPTDTGMSQCSAAKCQLPNCYCGSTSIPGGLAAADAPQMIILSFDAEINERNLPIYERLFHKNRKNQNGCNIKATFFVSHEFTNYGMVRYLYEKGHEIASHSITHGVGTGFKDEKAWETEMSGEKSFLTSFASIRPDDIKGARAPLLGPGGDDQFEALLNGGFLYDSTLVTPTSSKAPYWPYTMDFAMPHTCVRPPCPQRGYKGLWEIPLNAIYGLFGENCYEADRCTFGSTGDDVYKLLYNNFYDHHYSVNKAPFQLAIHADWLKYPPHREAYERFLDVVGAMPDVWIVTGSQAVAWMQQPTPVSQLPTFAPWLCSADDASRLPQCDTINACPLPFRDRLRYFYTCSECPAEFPWRPEQ